MTADLAGWTDHDRQRVVRATAASTVAHDDVIGGSALLRTVLKRVDRVAPTDSTVLITGETGTGKELIARAIHRRSRRAGRPFVSVNCAALPQGLIASELFGHERGSFTGALQRRVGRFEAAAGGTLFLDEVGELPAETQVTLLRVLQEREFERLGGAHPIRADVRVLAATNRDLAGEIDAGRFRSDLYYRLAVFPIEVPPLRARPDDIPELVEHFLDHYARRAGRWFSGIRPETFALLEEYAWPGNVRELQNVIERSVILCDTEEFSVDESWLTREPTARRPTIPGRGGLSAELELRERELIESALAASGGRVSGLRGAAARLGMPASTLESKIRALGITKQRFKMEL